MVWPATILFGNFEFDLAFRSEFDRVSEKIDQNLFDFDFIDIRIPGKILRDVQQQFEAFGLGPKPHHLNYLAYQFIDVAFGYVEVQLPSFNLGKIQNVIDDV